MKHCVFHQYAIFWAGPPSRREGCCLLSPLIPPSGGPKIAHSIEDSIGTIEAQIGCGVYCGALHPFGMGLHKKLRRVKTVRFRDAVFLRVESQPSKIEIFFLKKPDSIYFQPQTVIYATTNYYYHHHQKCLPPNNPALCPLLNPSFIVQCPRPVQKCSTTTSNICAKNTTHSPLSKRTRFANTPIRTSFPLTMP